MKNKKIYVNSQFAPLPIFPFLDKHFFELSITIPPINHFYIVI